MSQRQEDKERQEYYAKEGKNTDVFKLLLSMILTMAMVVGTLGMPGNTVRVLASLDDPHMHAFEYSLSEDGRSLTGICNVPDCTIGVTPAAITFTIDPGTPVYDGTIKSATVLSSINEEWVDLYLSDSPLKYYTDEDCTQVTGPEQGAEEGEAPSKAGTYWVTLTMWEAPELTAKAAFTITKANSAAPEVLPTGATGLVYTGDASELLGSAPAGLKYSLGSAAEAGATWSETCPTAANAGTYYVWYMLPAADTVNYNDYVSDSPVTVQIAKASQSAPVLTESEATTVNSVTLPALTGHGAASYAICTTDSCPDVNDPSLWQTSPEFTGLTEGTGYYFFARFAGDENYEAAVSTGLSVSTLSGQNNYQNHSYLDDIPSGSEMPAAEKRTVSVNGSEVEIPVVISGKTAAIGELTEEQIGQLAKGNDGSGVLFDLSSFGDGVEAVSMSADTLQQLTQSGDGGVSIVANEEKKEEGGGSNVKKDDVGKARMENPFTTPDAEDILGISKEDILGISKEDIMKTNDEVLKSFHDKSRLAQVDLDKNIVDNAITMGKSSDTDVAFGLNSIGADNVSKAIGPELYSSITADGTQILSAVQASIKVGDTEIHNLGGIATIKWDVKSSEIDLSKIGGVSVHKEQSTEDGKERVTVREIKTIVDDNPSEDVLKAMRDGHAEATWHDEATRHDEIFRNGYDPRNAESFWNVNKTVNEIIVYTSKFSYFFLTYNENKIVDASRYKLSAAEQAIIAINSGLAADYQKDKLELTWGRSGYADGYLVYAAYNNKKFGEPVAKITSKDVTSVTLEKLGGKAIDPAGIVKFYVTAYYLAEDGTQIVSGKSITARVVGPENDSYTNAEKINVKNELRTGIGKKKKINAATVAADDTKKLLDDSNGKKFTYRTTNPRVATVNSKGVITGVAAGTCDIYVYGMNGCAEKIQVTVK